MKQILLVLILIGIGVWAYFQFRSPVVEAPSAHEPHLARQGTFFVLDYVSIPAPHGVIGFEPGREVHFVRVDHEKGLLVVSDGQYEVEMKPSQLTNDLDIAALARRGDEDSQHQIKTFIEHEKAVYAAATRAANIRYAQEVERADAHLPPVSPAQAANTGPENNPYSYLSSPH